MKPYPPQSLEAFLADRIAHTPTDSIDLDDLVDAVQTEFHAPPLQPETAVTDCLERNQSVFVNYQLTRCEKRAGIFKGAQFIISPQPEEIQDGFLVPGHRFIPFTRVELHPGCCTVTATCGDTKKALPWRTITMPFSAVRIYLALYGNDGMLQYLGNDDEANLIAAHDARGADFDVTLNVLDIRDLKEQCNLKEGDAFRCTVIDWENGTFAMEHLPAGTWGGQVATGWLKRFEELLVEVEEEELYAYDSYEQLAQALWRGGDLLMKNPPSHIGGVVGYSKKLLLRDYQGSASFMPADTDIEAVMFARSLDLNDLEPVGRLDTLEAIANDTGLSINLSELRAMVQQDIAEGECSAQRTCDLCLAGRDPGLFYSREQEKAFKARIAELVDHERSQFDPAADAAIEPTRKRLLKMLQSTLQWLREADARGIEPSALPVELAMQLGHISAIVSQTLDMLVTEAPHSPEGVRDLNASLAQFERILNDTLAALRASVQPPPPGLRVLTPATHAYQLKIALNGAKPPIWRRVLVRDNTHLDELHQIIQLAMGWRDCHLHGFEHDGVRYEPKTDDDFFDLPEATPEDTVELRTLLKAEKDKLTYTYDFGDDWDHTITLEKILPIDPDATYPRCIKGKRACPPEDCGGIWGYMNLLEILADPSHPQHEELQEWSGNITPETFDLERANARLHSLNE